MKLFLAVILGFLCHDVNSDEINLFTTRHYESDIEIYKKFEKQTGIKVNFITGKSKPLEKRIIEEGASCTGDLFFLADAGRLVSAEKKDLFRKISSSVLEKKIPKEFRSDYWFGISKRSRIIFYNPEKISFKKIKDLNYEDLSNAMFRSSIAIRQSNNVYNQSLIASMIENNGVKNTEKWLKGFVKNFSRIPQGNDRAQILSVAAGESNFAIANTYYFALMISGKKGKNQQLAARKVKPLFPNQMNRGSHINISGIGVLKHSKNPEGAKKFIEFLLTPEVQKHIVDNTYEYPMIDSVNPSKEIVEMGKNFKQDKVTNVSSFGKWQKKAFQLMKDAGWN